VRVAFVAVALLVSLAGCSGPTTGVVRGGIQPCSALGIPVQPEYAPGTVTVLEGQVGQRSTGPGSWVFVLPANVVASEQVGRDATYAFTLRPGEYVLAGRQLGEAAPGRWVEITVRAGETMNADIPNDCI
jgi:hypothetical protein